VLGIELNVNISVEPVDVNVAIDSKEGLNPAALPQPYDLTEPIESNIGLIG
jgi:hypothetical protein